MTSILTNTGAMVALQTLKGINSNMTTTQSEISTGKRVSSAKDNAAVWAIAKVMESDVKGFKGISDSLALGSSTVAVARQASETVTDLLTQMKGKIVAAQEANVDRAKIQTDVAALRDQITSVVGAAQFNGLNLVDNSTASAAILASLDRDSAGSVTSSSITVTAQNLSTGGYVAKAAFTGSDGVSATAADSFGFALDAAGGIDVVGSVTIANPVYAAGDNIAMRVGDKDVSYTVTAQDIAAGNTPQDVIATNLKAAIEASGAAVTVAYNSASPGVLAITNTGTTSLSISGQFTNANAGGLGLLATIDVSTSANAATALTNVETLINTTVDAAASFGSAQGRIETQATFISNLSDSMKAGIGAMVDANMEEVSARLQALQVQQQLGVQSLSIANQAPQSILSLFR